MKPRGVSELDRDIFARQVQDALTHLYDHVYLRQHSLARLLAADPGEVAQGRTLHRILLEAIDSLKPPRDAPQLSVAWRRYHYFFLRYVEGMSALEAAEEVAISERQARRYHHEALEAVITSLWEMCCVQPRASRGEVAAELDQDRERTPREWRSLLEAEVSRLGAATDAAPVQLTEVLESVLATVANLARSKTVSVRTALPGDLPLLTIDRALLRPVFFAVLTYAISHASRGTLTLRGTANKTSVCLDVDIAPSGGLPTAFDAAPPDEEGISHLDAAERLLASGGGALNVVEQANRVKRIRLTLPAIQAITVLVIDDNPDLVQLFRRYLSGRPYQVAVANDGVQAVELARQTRPQIITLDLMMPSQDGWELLQMLRNLPETRDVPIVVCSVLRERELAVSLGATDFIAKPVHRQALLTALERCWPTTSGSRVPVSGGASAP